MQKLVPLAAGVLVLFVLSSVVRADDPKPADENIAVEAPKPALPIFADKNLEAVVRKILRTKTDADVIKPADLETIFFLEARGKGISNLTGLEYCKNLASIKLVENQIADLSPLAGLKNVQTIDISKNKIADLGPLAGWEKLQYLKADENQIDKLDALANLKRLTSLYISHNKIASLQPLAGLEKLVSLDVSHNAVKDLAPLAGLKWLASLNLQHNGVVDLAPLNSMTELRYTMLQGNQVTDLGVLVEMAKKDAAGEKRFAPYWFLFVGNNPLSDQAKGAQLDELRKVGVRVNVE